MLTDIKAILFDLDGTLIDSMWIWEEVDRVYMEQLGLEYEKIKLQENINGMSFTETAEFFKKTFDIPESIDEIKATWVKMAEDFYRNKISAKENVPELLSKLKGRGIKMGIGTSNTRELLHMIVEKEGIAPYFDTMRTSCEVKAGKPHPDIYLKVAEDLGINPENCLVFEDIPEGVQAAKNAGMRVCAVYDAYSEEHKESLTANADYYIHNYSEVLSLLEDENDEELPTNY